MAPTARGTRTSFAAAAIEAIVCVRTGPATSPEEFVTYLAAEPAVEQVWRVAADIDAIVRLTCSSLAELEGVVARMRHHGVAEHTATHLVLPSKDSHRAERTPTA
jgi:hypothetical protein